MYHTGTGRIIYDPRRSPTVKKGEKWWCIVNVDQEITRYYRWYIEKELHIKGLCKPSWDAHISIVRGEKPKPEVIHLWKKYQGQVVEFHYKHFPERGGGGTNWYWFVEVDCPFLLNIRRELLLPCNWRLHLTVGRTWY